MTRRQPKPWTAEEIAEVKAWEAKQLAAGMCPWSGLPLDRREDGSCSCSICDCNGVDETKVGKP